MSGMSSKHFSAGPPPDGSGRHPGSAMAYLIRLRKSIAQPERLLTTEIFLPKDFVTGSRKNGIPEVIVFHAKSQRG